MDATFSRSALEPLQPVLLAFLWLSLAGLLVVDLVLPDITLLPFYSIPALIGAVLVSTRQVVLLSLAGLACALYVGVHFDFLGTADYLVRLAAVFGIVVLAVVLTAARNRQIEEIESERARVRATLDSLLDPHILMRAMRDAGGKITDFLIADANDAACLYNRLPRSGFVGHRLLELLPAHVATGLLDLYRRAIESGRPLVLDDYLYPHDILEEPRYYDIRGVKVGDALSFTWRDVTERHNAAASLEQRARTDELTKLLNRRGVFEKLEDLRGKSPRTGRDIAVLFCDMDKFKSVNDTYGHAAGDEVLRVMADRIHRCLRSTDDLGARVGGDELLVVLHGVQDMASAVAVAEKLRASAAEPIPIPGGTVNTTVSIGVTLARPGEKTGALVARADEAMYRAKQTGRNQVISIDQPAES